MMMGKAAVDERASPPPVDGILSSFEQTGLSPLRFDPSACVNDTVGDRPRQERSTRIGTPGAQQQPAGDFFDRRSKKKGSRRRFLDDAPFHALWPSSFARSLSLSTSTLGSKRKRERQEKARLLSYLGKSWCFFFFNSECGEKKSFVNFVIRFVLTFASNQAKKRIISEKKKKVQRSFSFSASPCYALLS